MAGKRKSMGLFTIGVYTSILWFYLLAQIKARQRNACHMI